MSGVKFKARVMRAPSNLFEIVADATADAPGVNAAIMSTASKIQNAAKVNITSSAGSTPGAANRARNVAEKIEVLSIKEFMRGANAKNGRSEAGKTKGSRIPVSVVASDSNLSQRFEFGYGSQTSFPMTRFLLRAALAASSSKGKFTGRGRSR
jgi:hypothetical protein